jgi:hypothetical protein
MNKEKILSVPSFTYRARRYVMQSPSTKKLSDFAKDRIIKGIAQLMSFSYKDGFHEGTAHKTSGD